MMKRLSEVLPVQPGAIRLLTHRGAVAFSQADEPRPPCGGSFDSFPFLPLKREVKRSRAIPYTQQPAGCLTLPAPQLSILNTFRHFADQSINRDVQ